MSITDTSYVYEITAANPIAQTADDLTAWTDLSWETNTQALIDGNSYTYSEGIKFGVFGVDLYDWMNGCYAATTYCNWTDYSDYYDGWAVGAYFYFADTTSWVGETVAFCLEDGYCAGVDFYSSSKAYTMSYQYADPTYLATDVPDLSDLTGWVDTYGNGDSLYYGFGNFFYSYSRSDDFPDPGLLFFRF